MTLNNKYKYFGVILLIAALAGLAWLANYKKSAESGNLLQNQNTENESIIDPAKLSKPAPDPEHTWEGILKASDDAKKGNLMLLTNERTVYIHTSRDYSALLGKTVYVSYDGTFEAFRLGDIVKK